MQKFIALLPMKGNSERVPGKNIKLFNGQPLFHHVLRTLARSTMISKICINTDSEKIADSAKAFSSEVEIIWRPKEIQGDFISMNDILNYDLSVKKNEHYFIQTHSTNPLLQTNTLDEALRKFISQKEFDSFFTVTRHQSRFFNANGGAINHDPNVLIRTQDLPALYEENSCFYIFTRDSFERSGKRRIGLKPLQYEIPKLEAFDIDTPEDFLIAEAISAKLGAR